MGVKRLVSQTKRIRVPVSDKSGYDREVVVKKNYVVKWEGNPHSMYDRTFEDLEEAKDLYEQHLAENPEVQEVILALQVKKVLPARSTFGKSGV